MSRNLATTALAATATLLVAPAVAVASAARTTRDVRPRAVEPRRAQPRTPAPLQVAIFGYLHQDVVIDVRTGAVGTINHSRVISAEGDAAVRWHQSFAQTPLRDVAHRLALVNRRW